MKQAMGTTTCPAGSGKDTVASSCELLTDFQIKYKVGDIWTTLVTLSSSKRPIRFSLNQEIALAFGRFIGFAHFSIW
jgi:hypothetical protein